MVCAQNLYDCLRKLERTWKWEYQSQVLSWLTPVTGWCLCVGPQFLTPGNTFNFEWFVCFAQIWSVCYTLYDWMAHMFAQIWSVCYTLYDWMAHMFAQIWYARYTLEDWMARAQIYLLWALWLDEACVSSGSGQAWESAADPRISVGKKEKKSPPPKIKRSTQIRM